jgi:hypothetical protein
MDAYFSNLNVMIEKDILSRISTTISTFAQNLSQLPEMKEKGVTKEKIIESWNAESEFKIDPSAVVTSSETAAAEKKRRMTDKNRKCQVKKGKGKFAGEACGKNCLVGQDVCADHEGKASATVASENATATPSAASHSDDEKKVESGDNKCTSLLTTGKNKGNRCSRNATANGKCGQHAGK